jgi:hypothetical protein
MDFNDMLRTVRPQSCDRRDLTNELRLAVRPDVADSWDLLADIDGTHTHHNNARWSS